jgi:hypothetical protein
MGAFDWALICANAMLCALLLRTGAAKIVDPAISAAALAEVSFTRYRAAGRYPPHLKLIRTVAVTEMVAAIAIAAPATRLPDQILVSGLGLSFVALGAVGRIRGSTQPCGCFGVNSVRPLGTTNMLVGMALIAAAVLNGIGYRLGDAEQVATGTALIAVIISVGWLFLAHSRHIGTVIGNILKKAESAG